MAFVFKAQFDSSLDKALTTDIKGAFIVSQMALSTWLKLFCFSSELFLSLVDRTRISKWSKY
jgi:hypothetical protein